MEVRWSILFIGVIWLASLAGLASADEPRERREFFLKYRLPVSINEEVGPGGQRVLASTLRPREIKQEPKYHCREPLYATVRLGVHQEAYPLVLDSSTSAAHGYDILYLDADRDGRITSEEQVAPSARSASSFGPVKFMVDRGQERCPQWFMFWFNERAVPRELTAINVGYYRGVVAFGDQKRLIAVVDGDGNGLYNDVAKGANWEGDRLLIDVNSNGKLEAGPLGEESQLLGRFLLVGDRYWRLDVAPDGSSVTVEPMRLPLGTLRA